MLLIQLQRGRHTLQLLLTMPAPTATPCPPAMCPGGLGCLMITALSTSELADGGRLPAASSAATFRRGGASSSAGPMSRPLIVSAQGEDGDVGKM